MIQSIFSLHRESRVTLIGAGPGDPGLITIKAVEALKCADLVLYDALVSNEILGYIPVGTPALSVGKRAGAHSCSQEEINELIVEFALLYGHVVRLKGGDPFVFGRGAEEVEFAGRFGIPAEVIPGVSSALAVPASVGIPVTARGYSESFWVVTGTTMAGEVSGDVALAAQSSATIVIMMGMSKLATITDILSGNGRSESPAAIIQNGTMAEEKYVTGTVSTIEAAARASGIGAPAIIVVGEVVRLGKFSHVVSQAREAIANS